MIFLLICIFTIVVSTTALRIDQVIAKEYDNCHHNGIYVFSYFVALFPGFNLLFIGWILMLDGTGTIKKGLSKENSLYRCNNDSCSKYFRRYQSMLRGWKINRNDPCPHCDSCKYHSREYYEMNWQKTHPDCPQLGFLGLLKLIKTKNKLRKIHSNIENIDSFMEYQKQTNRL